MIKLHKTAYGTIRISFCCYNQDTIIALHQNLRDAMKNICMWGGPDETILSDDDRSKRDREYFSIRWEIPNDRVGMACEALLPFC